MSAQAKSGKLTTHVLDTARGCPAAGMKIELHDGEERRGSPLCRITTNADGRCDQPMRAAGDLRRGGYELHFFVGEYFRKNNMIAGDDCFLDMVPVRFVVADERAHYHVPLLVSPYGFTTYRGS